MVLGSGIFKKSGGKEVICEQSSRETDRCGCGDGSLDVAMATAVAGEPGAMEHRAGPKRHRCFNKICASPGSWPKANLFLMPQRFLGFAWVKADNLNKHVYVKMSVVTSVPVRCGIRRQSPA